MVSVPSGLKVQVTRQPLLCPVEFDYFECTYSGADLIKVVYKIGGSGGEVICTINMTYSAGILQTMTRT